MGFLSGNSSWSKQAKGEGGFFHPEKRCPPVKDCDVKNFIAPTKKKAKPKAKPKAKEQPKKSAGGWPFAGSYDPHKGKQRGKG